MRLTFTRSARRHKIGRARVRAVIGRTPDQAISVVGRNGGALVQWIGRDDRGVELEIVGERIGADGIEIFHVMPTALRGR